LPDIELSWWLGQQRPRVRATHRSLTALYLSEGCYTERDAKLLAMHRLGGTVKAEWYDWQM
jgi:hypothetical protein